MQLRIELAKRLLEDPGFKPSEIPEAIGYTDYPHFAKVFKKVCGISPSEYRKRLGV
jgi:two-component system response regulator YesN